MEDGGAPNRYSLTRLWYNKKPLDLPHGHADLARYLIDTFIDEGAAEMHSWTPLSTYLDKLRRTL